MLATNECSGVYVSAAQSSDMSADLNLKVYSHSDSTYLFPSAYSNNRAALSTIMIGTNEANSKQTSGYQTGVYRPSQYGVLSHLSIPRPNKLYGQDAGCTKTGTWTNDNQFFTGMGVKSNTNGDTVSCAGIVTTAADPFIYFGYGAIDGNGGTFTAKVDGVTCTDTVTSSSTLNNFGATAIATTNGATKAVFGGRCAAAAGTHTLLITVTSATNAANVVSFQWGGSMPSISGAASSLPRILESGVLKQRTDTNAPWTTNYNGEISSIVSTLAGDTMPIQFVTVNDLPTITGDYTDGIHPNDILHALIHDRFSQYMQGFGGNKFTSVAIGGGTATNQWLQPTICITNSQGEFAFGACPTTTANIGDFTGNIDAHNINSENAFQLYNAGKGNNLGVWAATELDITNNASFGWSNSNSGVGTIDTRLSKLATGVVSVDTTTAGNTSGAILANGGVGIKLTSQATISAGAVVKIDTANNGSAVLCATTDTTGCFGFAQNSTTSAILCTC